MKAWLRAVVATGLMTAAGLACSSAGTTAVSGKPFLSGTYAATSAGPIAEITFYLGNQYILVDSDCAEDSSDGCSEAGSFKLDAAGDTLLLSPAVGEPHTLPISDVEPAGEADEAPQSDELHIENLTTGSPSALAGSGSGSGLTQSLGGSLVCSPTQSQATPAGGFKAGPQSFKASSSQADPTKGWSCSGSFNKTKSSSGAYYITTFGCAGGITDKEDNCCSAGAVSAYNEGLCPKTKAAGVTPSSNCSNACGSNSSCDTWRQTQTNASYRANYSCEQEVQYYTTGAPAWGANGTLLCISLPDGSKSIVVDAYDSGPSCAIERRVSAYVLDVSPMVGKYLYGGTSFAANEKKKVLVSTAPSGSKVGGSCTCAAPSTPMTPGPNTFVGEAESE